MAFRLGTYNVLDLFDDHPLLPRKLDALAGRIRELDVDVIGLQEIGSEAQLEALRARISEGGRPYTTVCGTADARGIRCAAFSRLPVLASRVHTTDSMPFPVFVEGDPAPFAGRLPLRRGIVHVEVDSQGERVHVLVVHFKSGRPAPLKRANGEPIDATTSFDAAQGMLRALVMRSAEALFVRQIADEIFAREPGALIAVLGDFNDVFGSIVIRVLRGLTHWNATRVGVAAPDALVGDTELFDATRLIPYERRHTLLHAGVTRAIDHVFVSSKLKDRIVEAKAWNEDLRDHDALRETGETSFHDSDHAALTVGFA